MLPAPRDITAPGHKAIRVLMAFARSGGTYANRVLGAHPGFAVLSEVNPAFSARPVAWQAANWLGLCGTEQGAQDLARKGFGEQVRIMNEAAQAQGRQLVLRDWATVNFLPGAWRGLSVPSHRLETLVYLRRAGLQARVAVIVREARAVYRSVARNFVQYQHLGLDEFAEHYLRYAQAVRLHPKFKPEDLSADPEQHWQHLAKTLKFPFDASSLLNYQKFSNCTGDSTLAPPPPADEGQLAERSEQHNERLDEANTILGYT